MFNLFSSTVCRFPDNFVQAPESTQGYNRYSYCLNNPLQWVDPSGERYRGAEPPRLLHEHIREDMWDGGYFSDYLSSGGMSYDRCGPNRRYEMLFHQPHLFTTADGTTYKMSYYWAAVGVGGVYKWLTEEESELLATITHSKDFGILWHSIITPYEENWHLYTKIVQVGGAMAANYFGSGVINGLNCFTMSNGVKTNLFEAAVRDSYSYAHKFSKFKSLSKAERLLYSQEILGDVSMNYLRGSKIVGGAVSGISTAMELMNYGKYTINNGFEWSVTLKVGLDVAMTSLGVFGGPIGFAVSSVYYILDLSTRSFGGFGKMD